VVDALSVRDASDRDLQFVQRMLYEAANRRGEEWPPFDVSMNEPRNVRFWRDFVRPGDVAVIAEKGQRPIGAAWVRRFAEGELGPGDDPAIPVLAIGIEPDHRGQGIGKLLMSDLIPRVAASGAPAIDLTTNTFNEPGIRLYLGQGFVEIWRSSDTVRMRLALLATEQ
jgi:ribosomal protein S18 acetylase RimI-like enzyme